MQWRLIRESKNPTSRRTKAAIEEAEVTQLSIPDVSVFPTGHSEEKPVSRQIPHTHSNRAGRFVKTSSSNLLRRTQRKTYKFWHTSNFRQCGRAIHVTRDSRHDLITAKRERSPRGKSTATQLYRPTIIPGGLLPATVGNSFSIPTIHLRVRLI